MNKSYDERMLDMNIELDNILDGLRLAAWADINNPAVTEDAVHGIALHLERVLADLSVLFTDISLALEGGDNA